ncbi:putative ATP-dependent RNA helicase DDX20 [Bagarius yarrelli]|uniref:RNA helicase n=1 Tax=Bagarius yarrelli TaxID=175774 RepID=A0A556U7T1_BAGYA|nr:putative ATP-dependent RNA helicase DDX20 [Bagarius yarrelli]
MAVCLRKAAHEIDIRTRTDDVLSSGGVDFSSLLLSKPVLKGLATSGFQRPSPIQLKAIPLGRCGLDLIVQAKSGTGKTCVFSTIALDSLILENASTQVLVLAPTREIAVQIHAVVMAIGSAMEGLECHVFIGGRPVSQDKLHLKKCHIAIGSPGRIKQLIEMGALMTASIRLFVLDEADKLMEEGSFQEQINWIFSSLPVNKQMLALSATYPESLAQHLCRYMREPTFVRLNPTDPGLLGLKQFYKLVPAHALPHKIFEEKVHNMLELFSKVPFNQALVFSNLHTRAQHLADVLSSKGLPAVCISGSLSQEQRLEAMSKLKQYQCRVLISTDLTSRGIDAEKVNLVINLDAPQDWETYMHRIGRAGRFGTLGVAVTYCSHGEEENKMMAIAQKCNLALSPLPDPIPAGLMEEPCDWNVAVQAPSKKDLALSLRSSVDKKQPKSEQTISKPIKEPQHAPLTKDQTEHLCPDKNQKSKTDRKKSKHPVTAPAHLPTAESLEPRPALTRKEMQEALPKISPLPFFKPQTVRHVYLADAMADFEHFMTAGPGRSVEIIRQYGTHDEVNTMADERHENNAVDKAGTYDICNKLGKDEDKVLIEIAQSQHLQSSASYPVTARCGPDSSSSSLDSESEMETEQKTDASASSSLSSAPCLNSAQQHISKLPRVTPKANQPVKLRADPSKPQIKTHPNNHAQARQHCKSRSMSKKKRSGMSAKAEEGNWRTHKRIEERKEELSQEEGIEENGYNPDYWTACYQAWKEYYRSSSSAYYYHSHYNWLAAYRMNAVYMMEMMKP